MASLIIPEGLQQFTKSQAMFNLAVANINDLKEVIYEFLPELYEVIFYKGSLRPFVRIVVNNQLIDDLDESIIFTDNDRIELLVAVSGG